MRIKVNDIWRDVKRIEYFDDGQTDKTSEIYGNEIADIQLHDSDYSYKDLEQMHVDYACPDSDVQESMNDYDVTIAPLAERISELENSTTQLMNVLGVERTYTGEIRTHRLEDIEKHIDNLTDRLTRIDTIAIGQSKRIGELEELLRNIVRVLDIEKTEAESEIDGAIFSSYSSKVIGEIFDRIISLEHKAARSTVQEPIREHTDWEQRRYEIAKTLFATYAFSCSKPVKKAIEKADQLIEQLKKQRQ